MVTIPSFMSSKNYDSVLVFWAGAVVGAIGVSLIQHTLKKSKQGDGSVSASRRSSSEASCLDENDTMMTTTTARPAPRRYGAAIRLKPCMYKRYRELHDAVWPQVLDRMAASNIRNFVIYYHAETSTLLQHFEWVGHWNRQHIAAPGDSGAALKPLTADEEKRLFELDMQAIANDPVTRLWWKECEPCQEPFSQWPKGSLLLSDGGSGPWWAPLECVAHCGYWPVEFSDQQRDPDFQVML